MVEKGLEGIFVGEFENIDGLGTDSFQVLNKGGKLCVMSDDYRVDVREDGSVALCYDNSHLDELNLDLKSAIVGQYQEDVMNQGGVDLVDYFARRDYL